MHDSGPQSDERKQSLRVITTKCESVQQEFHCPRPESSLALCCIVYMA